MYDVASDPYMLSDAIVSLNPAPSNNGPDNASTTPVDHANVKLNTNRDRVNRTDVAHNNKNSKTSYPTVANTVENVEVCVNTVVCVKFKCIRAPKMVSHTSVKISRSSNAHKIADINPASANVQLKFSK